MSILAELINYTKNPTLETDYKTKNKLWTILKLTGFFIIIAFIVGLPQEYLLKIVGFDVSEHLISQSIKNDPYWIVFFSTVLFAPLFEEILYRLWLKPSFCNLTIGLGLLFSNIFGVFIPLNWLFDNLPILSLEVYSTLYFLLVSAASIIIVGIFLLLFEKFIKSNFSNFKHNSRNFKVAYYSSIILFAIVHAFNYDITKVWFIAPILVLPQLILGFYFGYIRMNFGIGWSIIAHFLNNILIILPILISLEATESIRDSIKDSNELIPKAVYDLPQYGQNLYIFALVLGSLFFIVSLVFTFQILFDYFKSLKPPLAQIKP